MKGKTAVGGGSQRGLNIEEVWDAIITGDSAHLAHLLKPAPQELVGLVGAEGQTPLHLACDVSDGLECVKLLVENGADIHQQDNAQRNPLLVACEVRALASAQHLLLHSDSSACVADESGMQPLHWLAMHGASELMVTVLKRDAEVDAANSSLQTPLHLALMRGELACSLVLLDAGASPSNLDEERRNALHLAMQYMVEPSESTLLLLRLLQLDPSLVRSVDADKRTPLHWACGKNALPCVKAIITSGADMDARDWAGRTPLLWAVLVDAAEAASELINLGADARVADRDQRTALHWAADRASESSLKLLLKAMANADACLDAVDWGGYTALHYAARRGAIGCVRQLLSHGANRWQVAMNGEVPTDMATSAVTKILLEERIGMKRQRSLSSTNSLVLFSVLPDLAKQFYKAWKDGDVDEHLTEGLRKEGTDSVLRTSMRRQADVDIDSMHVCTKTSKVVVELTAGGEKAMHSLTFTDEGLVSAFTPYTACC